jgi:hypothetical protein
MTTLSMIEAGIAYRETQAQIYRAIDVLHAQLCGHQHAAQAIGTDWEHVGELRDILDGLHRLINPNTNN